MNPKNQSADIFPLFDTFWNNAGLRGTVWNPDNYPTGLTKEIAKEDFKGFVDSFNSILYDFINLK